MVVCRQLKYDTSVSGLIEASKSRYDKRLTLNTVVNISCTGKETELQECQFKYVENPVDFRCNFTAEVKCSTGRYEKLCM